MPEGVMRYPCEVYSQTYVKDLVQDPENRFCTSQQLGRLVHPYTQITQLK
jgi:hypothetical protein